MEILETTFKSLPSWVWLYRGIITVWGVRHSKRQVIRLVAKQHQAAPRFWFRGQIISCDWIKYGSISPCVLDVVLMTLYCSSKTREPTRLMVLKSQKEGQDTKKTKVKTSPEASEWKKSYSWTRSQILISMTYSWSKNWSTTKQAIYNDENEEDCLWKHSACAAFDHIIWNVYILKCHS